MGRFPGQFLRRTELIKRSLRPDDGRTWWCLEPLQGRIALASAANRLSAFMRLHTATPRTTRSNIRPKPSRTQKTPRSGGRLRVGRPDAKACGDEIVERCLTALQDRRDAWRVHACDAELPQCPGYGGAAGMGAIEINKLTEKSFHECRQRMKTVLALRNTNEKLE